MPSRRQARGVATFHRHLEPGGHRLGEPHVAHRLRAARAAARPCPRVAQAVSEHGVPDRQCESAIRRVLQRTRQAGPGDGLRPPRTRSRGVQRVHFGQELRECPAVAQHRQHPRRMRLHQSPGEFLPDALGREFFDLAGRDQLAHQAPGFRRHREPEARGETRDAQHAQRILDERRRNMAQHAGPKIGLPAVGIDQRAPLVAGHGVDRQIAAGEILGERDVGRREELESPVSAAVLALGAGQRIFLAGIPWRKTGKSRPTGL